LQPFLSITFVIVGKHPSIRRTDPTPGNATFHTSGPRNVLCVAVCPIRRHAPVDRVLGSTTSARKLLVASRSRKVRDRAVILPRPDTGRGSRHITL
jgi:hypothetical protein